MWESGEPAWIPDVLADDNFPRAPAARRAGLHAVRIFFLHHATFSINSICHFFGRRRFVTADQSRNVAWLSVATFGESWHNNHHAFPTSAFHGLRRRELDLGGLFIELLESLGLAWQVVRVSPERQRRYAASAHLEATTTPPRAAA